MLDKSVKSLLVLFVLFGAFLFFMVGYSAPSKDVEAKIFAYIIGATFVAGAFYVAFKQPARIVRPKTSAELEEERRSKSLTHLPPEIVALVQEKLAFIDVAHINGIPGVNRNEKLLITLDTLGISFRHANAARDIAFTVPWRSLNFIEISDIDSRAASNRRNATMSGTMASSQDVTGALSSVIGRSIADVLSRHPLIIGFKLYSADTMISRLVLDSRDHKDIAYAIEAFRIRHVTSTDDSDNIHTEGHNSRASQETMKAFAELASLKEAGFISEEEFLLKKQDLLARM